MSSDARQSTSDMVAGAQARDPGLNSILLSMAADIGGIRSDVTHIKSRQSVIESTLWVLESDRQRGIGLRDGVTRYAKLAKSMWLVAGAVLAWIAAHMTGFPR